MPIALDPFETYVYVLRSDRDKSNPKPGFVFRFVTRSERRRIQEAWDRASVILDRKEASDADESALMAIVTGCLGIAFQGWENLPVPCPSPATVADLDDVLTFAELWELFWGFLDPAALSEREKKVSASPSGSDTGSSPKA